MLWYEISPDYSLIFSNQQSIYAESIKESLDLIQKGEDVILTATSVENWNSNHEMLSTSANFTLNAKTLMETYIWMKKH